MGKTVIAASNFKPGKYSVRAFGLLKEAGEEIELLSLREEKVEEHSTQLLNEHPSIQEVDSITLYMNPGLQKEYEDYLLSLSPKRIIFNPGAENPSLAQKAKEKNIEVLNACTLVMVHTGQY
ncbi:MAG: CoA-binding protein [Cyclobacteriaceae bacterium]|nr:CoA-binding protein [Cyclobacteriaceae bacterium]MCH8515958.1 CoA-binding protein [Cyclobacteriaceae bacterium]